MGLNMSISLSAIDDSLQQNVDPSLFSSSNVLKPKDLSYVHSMRHNQQTSIESMKMEAQQKLGINMNGNINYAFVGRPGVGKSSLINALRGLSDVSQGAAPVGVVETTMEIKKYPHPRFSHIVLWDFPGVGTLKQSEGSYFENNMLYAFDCIFILSSDRFCTIDYFIAYKAKEYKINSVFVRTKADIGIKSLARRQRTTMWEASTKFRGEVKTNFNQGICTTCDNPYSSKHIYQLFILSAWAFRNTRQTYSHFNSQRMTLDESLQKMDEDIFIYFITRSISTRIST